MASVKHNKVKINRIYVRTLMVSFTLVSTALISVLMTQPDAAVATEACAADSEAAGRTGVINRAAIAMNGDSQESGDALFWNGLSKAWMTEEQIDLLKLAYKIGYEHGGAKHAELVQAVLLQETLAGMLGRIGHMTAPVGKRSYGIMQVKVTAARDMLRKHSELGHFSSDEELIVKLMSDDAFNIRVASLFLEHLQENTSSVDETLVAYNIGLNGSKGVRDHRHFKYVVRTKQKLESIVKPFNERFVSPQSVQVAMK